MPPQHVKLASGVTVLGNLAIDVINGAPKSPRRLRLVLRSRLAGRCWRARSHRGVGRAEGPCAVRFAARSLPARSSGSCPLTGRAHFASTTKTSITVRCRSTRSARYGAGRRSNPPIPTRRRVHLAPAPAHRLPSKHFGPARRRGHRVAYDGRGLVRADRLGPLVVDRHYPPELAPPLSVCSGSPRTRRSSSPTAHSTSRRPSDSASRRSWSPTDPRD